MEPDNESLMLSLEGMLYNYEEISEVLEAAIKTLQRKQFVVIK